MLTSNAVPQTFAIIRVTCYKLVHRVLRLLKCLCNVGTALMTDPLHKQYLTGGSHADDANGHCRASSGSAHAQRIAC